MRALLLALPVLLVACASGDADAPPAPAIDPTDATMADAPAEADGAADADLVGFWTQTYTQYTEDGDPVVQGTNVYWTLREDGTAREAKQDDRLGPDPLTEDLTWTRSGDVLAFTHAATGDPRAQYDVVRLEGDTLTVHTAERRQYLTFARGPVNE